MGKKCAPTFTNLFMASLEEEFLNSITEKDAPKPCLWMRFIDDIFLIWPSSKESFLEFFNQLNSHHLNIKYTFKAFTTDALTYAQALVDIATYLLQALKNVVNI